MFSCCAVLTSNVCVPQKYIPISSTQRVFLNSNVARGFIKHQVSYYQYYYEIVHSESQFLSRLALDLFIVDRGCALVNYHMMRARADDRIFQYKSTSCPKVESNFLHRYSKNAKKWLSLFTTYKIVSSVTTKRKAFIVEGQQIYTKEESKSLTEILSSMLRNGLPKDSRYACKHEHVTRKHCMIDTQIL